MERNIHNSKREMKLYKRQFLKWGEVHEVSKVISLADSPFNEGL